MAMYEIDFSAKKPYFSVVQFESGKVDYDDVAKEAEEFIQDTYEDLTEINVDGVRELKS